MQIALSRTYIAFVLSLCARWWGKRVIYFSRLLVLGFERAPADVILNRISHVRTFGRGSHASIHIYRRAEIESCMCAKPVKLHQENARWLIKKKLRAPLLPVWRRLCRAKCFVFTYIDEKTSLAGRLIDINESSSVFQPLISLFHGAFFWSLVARSSPERERLSTKSPFNTSAALMVRHNYNMRLLLCLKNRDILKIPSPEQSN